MWRQESGMKGRRGYRREGIEKDGTGVILLIHNNMSL
jgi:hypothetical protein